jgi:gamma-glutamylputrescine oxidase
VSVSYWHDRSKTGREIKTDIAVIGGGIAGISTAYWLDQYNDIDIVVIEKGKTASGATGRNAGFLLAGTAENYHRMKLQYGDEKARRIYGLTVENRRLISEELIEKMSIDCRYKKCGAVTAAISDTEYGELTESYNQLRRDGFDAELLGDELNDRLNITGFIGGLLDADDACLDPVRLIEGMRSHFSERVTILEQSEVFDIESNFNRIVIRSERAVVRAEMVVAAVNGYAPLLFDFLKGKIIPTRGQVLATAPVRRKLFDNHTVYCDFGYEYFRQLDNGVVLLGGFRQHYNAGEMGYSDETTDNIQNGLEEFLARHIPAAADSPITHRWSGIMGFTPDGLPIIGEIPGHPGIIFFGGFTGHGLGFAFVLARALAQQLMCGRCDYPLEIFSTRRLPVRAG